MKILFIFFQTDNQANGGVNSLLEIIIRLRKIDCHVLTNMKTDVNSVLDNYDIPIYIRELSKVEKYPIFKNDNLIIDFSNNFNIELDEILLISQLAMDHKNNNKSFVIVCNGFDIDEIIIVPTFKEAEDVIEIEGIERDL